MRITSKQISKAIEQATGDANVHVYVDRRSACCTFYNDIDTDTPLIAAHSSTVYVTRLSDMSIDEWVQEYKDCIDNIDGII